MYVYKYKKDIKYLWKLVAVVTSRRQLSRVGVIPLLYIVLECLKDYLAHVLSQRFLKKYEKTKTEKNVVFLSIIFKCRARFWN